MINNLELCKVVPYMTALYLYQVNTNGVISFLISVSQYTPDRFPLRRRRLVAPFWADVDTTVGGQVFYRESTDQSLLKQATADVTKVYVNCKTFRAAWLLVATWFEVGFYGAQGHYTSKVEHVFNITMISLIC